jgi:hypothetical protein
VADRYRDHPAGVGVNDVEVPEAAVEDTTDVSADVAHALWAEAARELLIDAARRYHHVVTVKALAAEVQERTAMVATRRAHHWIDDVLGLVAEECVARGEPNLTSLCVNAQGSVGGGYVPAVTTAAGEGPVDADDHAAVERLACYTYFGARGLPADGGVAVLTAQLSASRSRLRKAALDARELDTCPTCYLVLPAQGGCNNCD